MGPGDSMGDGMLRCWPAGMVPRPLQLFNSAPPPPASDHRVCEPAGFCASEGPLPSSYAAITAGLEGNPSICDLCSQAVTSESGRIKMDDGAELAVRCMHALQAWGMRCVHSAEQPVRVHACILTGESRPAIPW